EGGYAAVIKDLDGNELGSAVLRAVEVEGPAGRTDGGGHAGEFLALVDGGEHFRQRGSGSEGERLGTEIAGDLDGDGAGDLRPGVLDLGQLGCLGDADRD